MLKRVISGAMSVLFLSLTLVACGTGASSGASSPSSESADVAAASATATGNGGDAKEEKKEVTLTLWQTPADVTQTVLDYQAKFQEAYPYIKLNIVQTPQNADLLSALAAGNAPSIGIAGYPQFNTQIYQGAYLPLDDYIAATPDFANLDPLQVETFTVNGKVYGVPGGKYALGLAYNKRNFEAAGLTAPPKDWDEFFEYCQKLTIPEKQQYGFALNIAQWGGWHFEMWAWAAGGEISLSEPDGTLKLTFTDPNNIVAAEYYRKLINANVIQPDRNMMLDELNKDFTLGKASIIVAGLGDNANFVRNGMKPEDIGFFNLPAGPSGKGYNLDGGDGTGIVYTTDKDVADAAWEYLMFMSSKEYRVSEYEEIVSRGSWSPRICPRTDIDMTQFGDIDPELQKALDEGSKLTHHEFYGKGAVGSFLDDAVAKFAGDTTTDIIAVLQAEQDKAAQAVDDFNAALKQ